MQSESLGAAPLIFVTLEFDGCSAFLIFSPQIKSSYETEEKLAPS